jgi:uncharacterized protein YaaN involved in tellurite resistance
VQRLTQTTEKYRNVAQQLERIESGLDAEFEALRNDRYAMHTTSLSELLLHLQRSIAVKVALEQSIEQC